MAFSSLLGIVSVITLKFRLSPLMPISLILAFLFIKICKLRKRIKSEEGWY